MAVCFLMPSTPEVRRFQHNLQLRLYFVVRLLLWILSSTEANEALSCDTFYLYGTLRRKYIEHGWSVFWGRCCFGAWKFEIRVYRV